MKNKLVNIAMKKSKLWMSGKMRHFSAFLLLAALCLTSCQEYTLEDEVPAWLGTSIYDNLNSTGEYTNMVRLIEDLGYKDVLARTGSKTLFVADDAAFERFYSNNDWGVRGYNELSVSQKRMLLYGATRCNCIRQVIQRADLTEPALQEPLIVHAAVER